MKKLTTVTLTLTIAVIAVFLTGCEPSAVSYQPTLLLSLPDSCNTPDGMSLAPDGSIILACPNFNDTKYPGVIVKIDTNNDLSEFYPMPIHPETKRGCPMGLNFGPDGNLYVADNQYFYDKEHKSRLVRINIKDGKPVSSDVVVDGFKLSNAVAFKGNDVYISDTFFDLPDKPGKSGVYKFSLDEFTNGTIQLKPNATDPHLIATFTTIPNHRNDAAGADGLTFDSRGNLYASMFGDGAMYKITFNDDGTVKSNDLFVRDDDMQCADGMIYHAKTNTIYVTDSQDNAIHAVTLDGKRTKIWENDDADGSDGLLDQPAEPIIRGNELIIANFDMPFPSLKNSEYDQHHTISVIKLNK